MLKITIQVQENKGKDTCNVKLITPKDLSKVTQNENNTGAMIYNKIDQVLQELKLND